MNKLVLTGLLIASPAVALAQDAPAPAEGEATTPPAGGETATTPPAGGGGDAAMPMKKMTVGADVAFVLPLGDYADGADAAIGALGRFEFAVNPALAVTARLGYLYNIGTPDGVSLSMIPVLVGAAYSIGTSGLFVDGEVGLTNIRVSVDIGGMTASDSETKLSIQAGAGYKMNKIKARVGFYMPGSEDNGNGSTTLYGIMASVGFDFAQF